jgi:type II secretory pathway component PulK
MLTSLVVIAMLSLAAYQYLEMMSAQYQAADNSVKLAQARALAASGVHYAAALLSNQSAMGSTLGGNPLNNNPGAFQGQTVDGIEGGTFNIVAPDGNGSFLYGVIDETGKININALMRLDPSGQIAHDVLLQLPPLQGREDIVNAILDWIDPDESERTSGAESNAYSSLGYQSKNAPLDSLEELLLVQGMTPQILWGNDRNRNGVIDPEEDDGSGNGLGLASYITVNSREQNLDSSGNPRIYLNQSDLNNLWNQLSTAVGEDLANYIVAYRTYGPSQTNSTNTNKTPTNTKTTTTVITDEKTGTTAVTVTKTGSPAQAPSTPTPSVSQPVGGTGGQSGGTGGGNAGGKGGKTPKLTRANLNLKGTQGGGKAQKLNSIFDLVNSKVSIPGTNGQAATDYPSPLTTSTMETLFPSLWDKTTTSANGELPARINVNTAPQAVLQALWQAVLNKSGNSSNPDLYNIPDNTNVDLSDPIYQTPTWLVTRANLKVSTLKALENYITTRSQVYRVQVIGQMDNGPTARIEAVIDTNTVVDSGGNVTNRPRILYWRDLTELGKGFDLQQQQQ